MVSGDPDAAGLYRQLTRQCDLGDALVDDIMIFRNRSQVHQLS